MKVGLAMSGDLAANLAKLPHAVTRQIQTEALIAAAKPIQEEASMLAPRDDEAGPPHLADRIVVQVLRDEDIASDLPTVAIGPSRKVFYGFFQEFGYGPGPAQPFMRPAFDQHVQDSLKIVQAHLWKALEQWTP